MLSNTLIHYVFSQYIPNLGRPILALAISLFVMGTIIGNSFNGRQSFATITSFRYIKFYNIAICVIIFSGALIEVPLAWAIADLILPLVALPNVLGLVYLAHAYPEVLTLFRKKEN